MHDTRTQSAHCPFLHLVATPRLRLGTTWDGEDYATDTPGLGQRGGPNMLLEILSRFQQVTGVVHIHIGMYIPQLSNLM
jgi:hypothetical protein